MVNLTQITAAQFNKHTTANDGLKAVAQAARFGTRPAAHTGLNWGFYGDDIYSNGSYQTIANGTFLCTASDVTFVYLDLEDTGTTPAIKGSIAGFPAGAHIIPLAEVTCGATTITSEKDRRDFFKRYQDQNVAAFAATLATNVLNGFVVAVGDLTANITISAPTGGGEGDRLTYLFKQDGTGGWTVTWNAVFRTVTPSAAGTANQTGAVEFALRGAEWVQIGAGVEWN
jgi:hypothetical protein